MRRKYPDGTKLMENTWLKILGSIALLVIYIGLISSPYKSFAWTCVNSIGPKELVKRHDSVFIGKVIETSYEHIDGINPKSRVKFDVESTIKGSIQDKITVVTTAGSDFIEGDEYLVYAYKTTEENYLYQYEEGEFATDAGCGGTKALADASEDLKQISEMHASTNHINTVMISGVVLLVIPTLIIISRRRKR